jgi:hypothetical protein
MFKTSRPMLRLATIALARAKSPVSVAPRVVFFRDTAHH